MELIQTQLPNALYTMFCVFAAIAALGVVSLKNPVSAAFCLIMVLLNVSGIFAFQQANFVAAVQVLVYAGAIMVLFMFVIMLLSIESVAHDYPESKLLIIAPVILAFVFLCTMVIVLIHGHASPQQGNYTVEAIQQNGGNIRVVSEVMFSDYILPFQIVGALLMFAVVGAITLAKRRMD